MVTMAESKLSEAALEVQRSIARHLNCLKDENRGTRRNALKQLRRVFFGDERRGTVRCGARRLWFD